MLVLTSLKVTWLRRLIMFSDSDNWSTLSRINLNKLFSLGDSYIKTVINDNYVIHSGNIFWRAGFNTYAHLKLIIW